MENIAQYHVYNSDIINTRKVGKIHEHWSNNRRISTWIDKKINNCCNTYTEPNNSELRWTSHIEIAILFVDFWYRETKYENKNFT